MSSQQPMNFKETLDFLDQLKENNSSEWVRNNRDLYDSNRKSLLKVAAELIEGISAFDPTIREADLKPAACMMRQNRDIRFSKDKAPYKTNCFMLIGKGGKKSRYASYYFSIQPDGNSFAGGGAYMPEMEDLKTLKSEILYNFDEWTGILNSPSFKKTFPSGVLSPENYVKVPKGYDAESPASEYLKMKGFYTKIDLTDAAMKKENISSLLLKSFQDCKPMIDFLNNAFD